MKKTRRKFSPAFKVKVVLEALSERCTLSELAQKYELHPNVIANWKKEFLEKAVTVFDQPDSDKDAQKIQDELYQSIGKLKTENDWLKKKLGPYL